MFPAALIFCWMEEQSLKKCFRKVNSEQLTCIHDSYDIVGDIAILRLTSTVNGKAKTLAETIMDTHNNVRTVQAQTTPVQGDFRLRGLKHVAGENKKVTIHRESGCLFSVELEKCYFSPRLSYERARIAKLVDNDDVVVNMFASVGCFSMVIAKHSNPQKVYSIDVNPIAVQYMRENVKLNRVYGKVVPVLGDAKEIIEKRLRRLADRVLMPLPEKALQYLPYALLALKTSGGWIHYYGFEHVMGKENPIEKTKAKVAEKLESLGVSFDFPFCRVVRSTGPNWHQTVLDIKVDSLGKWE